MLPFASRPSCAVSWQQARCLRPFVSSLKVLRCSWVSLWDVRVRLPGQSFLPSPAAVGVCAVSEGSRLSRDACGLCPSPGRCETPVSPAGRCLVWLSPEKPAASLLLPRGWPGPSAAHPAAEPVVSESSFPLWSRLVVAEM